MGESGCVSWMFHKKGLVLIDKTPALQEEDLLAIVLDAAPKIWTVKVNSSVTCEPEDSKL